MSRMRDGKAGLRAPQKQPPECSVDGTLCQSEEGPSGSRGWRVPTWKSMPPWEVVPQRGQRSGAHPQGPQGASPRDWVGSKLHPMKPAAPREAAGPQAVLREWTCGSLCSAVFWGKNMKTAAALLFTCCACHLVTGRPGTCKPSARVHTMRSGRGIAGDSRCWKVLYCASHQVNM